MKTKTFAVKNLKLKYNDGLIMGSWDIANPNDYDYNKAKSFLRTSEDIGWSIAFAICSGAKSVEFIYEKV